MKTTKYVTPFLLVLGINQLGVSQVLTFQVLWNFTQFWRKLSNHQNVVSGSSIRMKTSKTHYACCRHGTVWWLQRWWWPIAVPICIYGTNTSLAKLTGYFMKVTSKLFQPFTFIRIDQYHVCGEQDLCALSCKFWIGPVELVKTNICYLRNNYVALGENVMGIQWTTETEFYYSFNCSGLKVFLRNNVIVTPMTKY